MKKNAVPAMNSFSGLLRMIVCFLIVYSLTGCNSDDKDKPTEVFRNWITMAIKFKPNTTAEMRDLAIRTIEKVLIDSFFVKRDSVFQNYTPIITISRSPSTDTLQYDLNIGPGVNSENVQALPAAGKPTKKPPCNCSVNCGVCGLMHDNLNNPPTNSPEYGFIASITFPNPEIEPR